MPNATYYRKKDATAEEFFERLGRYIPLESIDTEKQSARFYSTSGDVLDIYCTNDEDVPLFMRGPRQRKLTSLVVQGEECGWQVIDLHYMGSNLFAYFEEIITHKFGAVAWDDFRLWGEPELEEWEEDETDFENLPPEIRALDPINPYRAWRLHNMSTEEREEDQRAYQEKERDQKLKDKKHAKLVRKTIDKLRRELLSLKPKVGRAWRQR